MLWFHNTIQFIRQLSVQDCNKRMIPFPSRCSWKAADAGQHFDVILELESVLPAVSANISEVVCVVFLVGLKMNAPSVPQSAWR